MSELRADTITASNGTGPVTLTKQEATKFWVTYDAVNEQTKGSLNQSSLVDETTGRYHSTFITDFGSSTDKCAIASVYNTTNNSAFNTGENRGGLHADLGTSTGGTFRALSAAEIQFYTNYGANAANGAERDFLAVYVMVTGDLA